MQHAPPVAFTAAGGWPWRLAQTLLYAAASAAVSVWALQRWGASPFWAVVLVSKVTLLAWVLLRPRPSRLSWDGAFWHWQPAGAPAAWPGHARVMLDGPGLMLLHWQPMRDLTPRPQAAWLAVSRGQVGVDWVAARVALFQPPPPAPHHAPAPGLPPA